LINRWSVLLSQAYIYRVPFCVPYWNWNTYAAIARGILCGNVISGSETELLKEILTKFLDVDTVIPCSSGRAALELALRAVGVSEADEVVVPTFCCRSVMQPIINIKAQPVFADVGPELNITLGTLKAVVTNRTRAVIVAHMFGNPVDIVPIIKFCNSRGIAVIDDAAQAYGATLEGTKLSTFGDFGIISFGKGKVCFGTGGGLLVSKNPKPNACLQASNIMQEPKALEELADAFSILFWRKWRRWSLPMYVALKKLGFDSKSKNNYSIATMSNIDAAVALSLYETLQENIQQRKQRIALYKEKLAGAPKLNLITHREGSACLTQVVQINSDENENLSREIIINALRVKGYEITRSYTPLHILPEFQRFRRVSLQNAENIYDRLLELPCEPTVNLIDLVEICDIVKNQCAQHD